jgi:prevent-host-death family protein
MRTFPSTDLKQTLGDVLDAASQEPIAITKHKKPRYVLMSIHDYEQRFQKDERKAFAAAEMPAEHLAMLEASRAGIEGEAAE